MDAKFWMNTKLIKMSMGIIDPLYAYLTFQIGQNICRIEEHRVAIVINYEVVVMYFKLNNKDKFHRSQCQKYVLFK